MKISKVYTGKAAVLHLLDSRQAVCCVSDILCKITKYYLISSVLQSVCNITLKKQNNNENALEFKTLLNLK